MLLPLLMNLGMLGQTLGGKGDNERKRKRGRIVKPTGLVDRPRKKNEIVEARVEQAREIAEEVAREARAEVASLIAPMPAVTMTLSDVDREIGDLLRKKTRTEEDELILMMLMAAAAA